MTRRPRVRNQRGGANIAEFAAVLVIGLPLLTLIVFVGLECSHFYTIKSAMEMAARNSARSLIVQYNTTGKTAAQPDDSTFFGNFFIPNYINNSSQFNYVWDTANNPPTYVTVSCAYPAGGGGGLPPFPAGPLRYLTDNAKFDLGTFTVRGTFTLPVQ